MKVFIIALILIVVRCEEGGKFELSEDVQETEQFYDDFASLQDLLSEMDKLSGFIMGDDSKDLSKEELQKISDQLDSYEQQIKDITKNYKKEDLDNLHLDDQKEVDDL